MIGTSPVIKEIGDNRCYIFRNECKDPGIPVFYWAVMPDAQEMVSAVVADLTAQPDCRDFVLAAFECSSWNDDLSPWEAPPVFGREGFGGGAGRTLRWLTDCLMPFVEDTGQEWMQGMKDIRRYLVGYSLAGLFSLWAYFEDSAFSGAVSCSGSFWYKGAVDHFRQGSEKDTRLGAGCIYLSLGDGEERTKNRQLSSVGRDTRQVYELIRKASRGAACTLEWNRGGHFSGQQHRVAKGIGWVLKNERSLTFGG